MAGTTIATAYVQILPSAEGIKGKLENALGGEVNKAGNGLASRLGGGLANSLKVAGAAAVAAIGAAGTAMVKVAKASLNSFKEYEQLEGGAKLMFGEEGYSKIAEYAKNAYKDVQMSQNDYLQVANNYATGLKKSLGGNGEAAAELANKIIKAQADIHAATGNSAESIQNAFAGIMKGNYTMLDNLGLGIAGTKQGMATVVKEMNAMHKKQGDGVKYQMGNLADMEAALVDYVAYCGLADYAQKEAMGTIEGSVEATKAAWQNLLTGFADENADIDSLINNLVESGTAALNNILPRIATVMEGLGSFLTTALPLITPIITQFISDNAPAIVDAGIQILLALVTGIITALPQLIAALPEIFASLKETFAANWPAMKEAGWQLFLMVGHGINEALSSIWETIKQKLPEWAATFAWGVSECASAIGTAFTDLCRQMGLWIDENIITPARDAIGGLISVGMEIVDNIKQGISDAWQSLVTWFKNIWNSLFGGLDVDVNVNKSSSGSAPKGAGNFATGLNYVPYDEFPAILHKGEAVLTADEASIWRAGGSNGGGMTINQYIQSVPQTPVQFASATAAYFEQARWTV